MARINSFVIPADNPERALTFYNAVFGWQFTVGWEYDTAQGRERYWHVATGGRDEPGIDGGLTRREFPGQPIGVGIQVVDLDEMVTRLESQGGKILVRKVAIPGVAWLTVCQDSESNTISLYAPDATAK